MQSMSFFDLQLYYINGGSWLQNLQIPMFGQNSEQIKSLTKEYSEYQQDPASLAKIHFLELRKIQLVKDHPCFC